MFRIWVSLIPQLPISSKLQSDVLYMNHSSFIFLVWFRWHWWEFELIQELFFFFLSFQHAQSRLHPVMHCFKVFFCSLFFENVEQFCCVCLCMCFSIWVIVSVCDQLWAWWLIEWMMRCTCSSWALCDVHIKIKWMNEWIFLASSCMFV